MRFSDAPDVMSKVFHQEPIVHDGTRERFFAEYKNLGEVRLKYLWDFFQYEQENGVVRARNDFVERILGRKPLSLSNWLHEHREQLLFGT